MPNSFLHNGFIEGFALDAKIQADIVVGAIAIVFAVFEIVFFVIATEVSQGKAVVCGDKIDALRGIGFIVEEVFASGKTASECGDGIIGAGPKAPHIVAEFSVPFGPACGKVTDFVESCGIPCLGDEF